MKTQSVDNTVVDSIYPTRLLIDVETATSYQRLSDCRLWLRYQRVLHFCIILLSKNKLVLSDSDAVEALETLN